MTATCILKSGLQIDIYPANPRSRHKSERVISLDLELSWTPLRRLSARIVAPEEYDNSESNDNAQRSQYVGYSFAGFRSQTGEWVAANATYRTKRTWL